MLQLEIPNMYSMENVKKVQHSQTWISAPSNLALSCSWMETSKIVKVEIDHF